MTSADDRPLMPGGGISRRPLDLFILADCSGSMSGEKIQALNYAIADMLPHLATWEHDQGECTVRVRAVSFGTDVRWHVEQPTPVSELRWPSLKPEGLTHMGEALETVAGAINQLERRALRPAIVMITDGRPTDDFDRGLSALFATPGGRAALRLAIAIGRDADPLPLKRFTDDPSVPVLSADRTEEIADRLVAASVAVSRLSELRVGSSGRAKQVLTSQAPQPSRDDEIL